jgi:hypothetical protein
MRQALLVTRRPVQRGFLLTSRDDQRCCAWAKQSITCPAWPMRKTVGKMSVVTVVRKPKSQRIRVSCLGNQSTAYPAWPTGETVGRTFGVTVFREPKSQHIRVSYLGNQSTAYPVWPMGETVGRTSGVTVFRKPKSQHMEHNNERVEREDDQDHCVQGTQTTG